MTVGLCISINISTDRPASYKAAGPPFEIFCGLQLEHKAATLALMTPHIARAINI